MQKTLIIVDIVMDKDVETNYDKQNAKADRSDFQNRVSGTLLFSVGTAENTPVRVPPSADDN